MLILLHFSTSALLLQWCEEVNTEIILFIMCMCKYYSRCSRQRNTANACVLTAT
ncbi:hypothetical protein WN51_00440 [Melipona quadrifasciata]|uniref:Uncharacterized protein n=1 Tax=Melipona quadrifasciata TaxID=166423 RepID=A0A0M9A058_9HYME|nr:hypothetical protein WN51_00440 [Melipona quadrifasciata]